MIPSFRISGHFPPFRDSAIPPFRRSVIPAFRVAHVDRLCATEGFEIVKSYYTNDIKLVCESVEAFIKWLWSSSHGVFDQNLVTEERIERFLSRVGNPPFDFTHENVKSRLIAVKPKERTDVQNEGAECGSTAGDRRIRDGEKLPYQ